MKLRGVPFYKVNIFLLFIADTYVFDPWEFENPYNFLIRGHVVALESIFENSKTPYFSILCSLIMFSTVQNSNFGIFFLFEIGKSHSVSLIWGLKIRNETFFSDPQIFFSQIKE